VLSNLHLDRRPNWQELKPEREAEFNSLSAIEDRYAMKSKSRKLSMQKPLRLKALFLSLLPLLGANFAIAQSSDATPADDEAALDLDEIVVTGNSSARSKMRSSISLSTLGGESIQRSGVQSVAEALRFIPGVRSEASGGEGNANITVRGVPISAGGARYVQLQEDGLPVLLFGDIAFATADQFTRADAMVERLEVVRGGTAATLATNSPGGIINFISKSGEDEVGRIGLDVGADYRYTRANFDVGTRLSDTVRMQIGGFYRVGEADGRNADFNAQQGGQLRANITKELEGSSYLRASIKLLNDSTPTFLPVPVRLVGDRVQEIPGIDPRNAFFITDRFPRDRTLANDNSFVSSDPRDGLTVETQAFGLEGRFDLSASWALENRLRFSNNDGRFIGLFPSNSQNTTPANTFNGVLFNTSLDSLDNIFNDLKLSHAFESASGATVGFNGGLFYGRQDVAQTWYWNQYTIASSGDNPAVTGPVALGPQTFGGCCVRTWNTEYTSLAPYLGLTFERDALSLDASVRRDRQDGEGFSLEDDGSSPGRFVQSTRRNIDYDVSHTSYSLGGNYAASDDTAFFSRYSDGASFSADRLLYGNPLDGSVPVAINEVKQFELGAKLRNGPLSAFITFFNARTEESNFEVTTQRFTSNRYRANGIELESGTRFGSFQVLGGLTYTDAEITGSQSAAVIGNTPRRQAKLVYQLQPSFDNGIWQLGVSLVGTSKSYANDENTIEMPGFAVFNAFGVYQLNERVQLSFAANNLFDKLGYTEIEGDGHAARAINGRTVRLGVSYTF
jgi:outer membrane receptor protein involved in Fe transport